MKTIVLPGHGNPVTFTPKEDTVIGVFSNGRIVNLHLKGNVSTRVQFLGNLSNTDGSMAA